MSNRPNFPIRPLVYSSTHSQQQIVKYVTARHPSNLPSIYQVNLT